ncbi:hypothetical protein D9619_008110 [Psilocybe cf. subviscida]|uniref:NACHT domain-containing protein n=1 Tax=Psilocybe cf. subviscida TaxID=2480587 RepID=A0A8H5AV41_9AGAR|nr:hypothetical protein D9619_008110 [Psilocybe cf. subviscida]
MKLTGKFEKLKQRFHARIGGSKSHSASPSTSNRGSIDSASGARDSGQGINAGQIGQAGLGSNVTPNQSVYPQRSFLLDLARLSPLSRYDRSISVCYTIFVECSGHAWRCGENTTLNQGVTSPIPPAVPPSSSAPGMSDDAVDQGSGREDSSADRRVDNPDLKSTAKDVLVLAWTGMEMLLKKVEKCLDGTLAKVPVAAINALIEIKNAVGDNKGAIEGLVVQTADRLLAMVEAVNQGVPDSAMQRTTAFTMILRDEIQKLEQMSKKGTFRRVLENEADKKAVEDAFKRIDGATKTFQIDIALATARMMEDVHSEIKLTQLDRVRAPKAIYNADLGDGVALRREACTEGTRVEIREKIVAWANDTSMDCPPVFWLTGDAGSGKTTIAYSIAEHFDKLEKTGQQTILGGTFHCSRQFEETRRQVHIIPTLVYQLARKSGSYYHALHKADKFDSVDKLDKQIEDLLAGPWQQSASQRHLALPPYLIIVDALDEINEQGGSKFLYGMLETVKQHHLHGLKFLFTSRPDPSVMAHFDLSISRPLCCLQDVPAENVGADITKFLQIKLPKFAHKEWEDMAHIADGLFISAATIVRYLTPDPSIEVDEQPNFA